MNTDQRRILRNGLYFLAPIAWIACFVIEGDAGVLYGIVPAVLLVLAAKFVWSGRSEHTDVGT